MNDPQDHFWGRLTVAVDKAACEVLASADYSKLGAWQRLILRDVWERLMAGSGDTVRWLPRPASSSESDALSRALAELERRGLLIRLGDDQEPGLPCCWVRITRAGIEKAKRLQPERKAA